MPRSEKSRHDYIDPRILEAPEKAAEILIKHRGDWSSVVDAYWLLRKHEDELGIPVTYDIVEKAYMIAERELRSLGKPRTTSVGIYQAASLSKRHAVEERTGRR